MISTLLRKRDRLAAALLLLLVAPLPAVAQDDPYTATVTVDATSDTVAKARDTARSEGARRALNAVIEKLAGGPDKTKPLKLSDNQVTDLVASFEVANEKMSAIRYVADYTYHFKTADVNRVMQSAGIAINQVLTTAVLGVCNFEAAGLLAAGIATQATATATSGTVLYTAANQPLLIFIKGSFTVTTAGTFGLQMCQNTSNASNTVVNIGSTMKLTRIA